MNFRSFRNLLRVIRTLVARQTESEIVRVERTIQILQNYDLELNIYSKCQFEIFSKEILYIKEHGLTVFPYKKLNNVGEIVCDIDKLLDLPYVIHKGKKLYFPKSYEIERCRQMYVSYIGDECLLGGNYREKQPHQYLTGSFKIDDGDILVDVGCAEALLSLDNIEIVSKVYLFEADQEWIPALNATFKPYIDKVTIINKFVSDKDSDNAITLETVLKDEIKKKMFVKMDIEGAEVNVIKGSQKFLTQAPNIKIACCTYHRQNDEKEIKSLYDKMGFKYEFSDGYMLFLLDKDLNYPYFRRGVIRGWK